MLQVACNLFQAGCNMVKLGIQKSEVNVGIVEIWDLIKLLKILQHYAFQKSGNLEENLEALGVF